MIQQKEIYVNDLSTITDLSSFIEFIKIAFQTNPLIMIAAFIYLLVVYYISFLIARKVSRCIEKHIKEYFIKGM